MKATRREALKGALAVPMFAGLPQWRWRHGTSLLLLFDASLEGARRVAAAGAARGDEVLAIEGDRIRFARNVFARRPAYVVGVSRPADALLISDVGREAGYVPDAAGTAALDELMAGTPARDRGLVLGWVLAPSG
jgi:hypothetical protein